MDQNPNLIEDLKESIKINNINICLWWNNSIQFEELNQVLNKNIINIFFNWDPFLYNYQKYNVQNFEPLIENKSL